MRSFKTGRGVVRGDPVRGGLLTLGFFLSCRDRRLRHRWMTESLSAELTLRWPLGWLAAGSRTVLTHCGEHRPWRESEERGGRAGCVTTLALHGLLGDEVEDKFDVL